MFRTSGFLAIALSITAIGSAITPAAARPFQALGGQVSYSAIRDLAPHKIVDRPNKLKSSMRPTRMPVSELPVGSSTMPVAAPVRLAAATASDVATQATPAVAAPSLVPQCGADTIPALATGIDALLPTAQLSNDDITKVTELRQMIQDLATDGKVAAARNAEEVAMYYLGYQKIWPQCGLGTFAWQQIVYNDAVRTADQSK